MKKRSLVRVCAVTCVAGAVSVTLGLHVAAAIALFGLGGLGYAFVRGHFDPDLQHLHSFGVSR